MKLNKEIQGSLVVFWFSYLTTTSTPWTAGAKENLLNLIKINRHGQRGARPIA